MDNAIVVASNAESMRAHPIASDLASPRATQWGWLAWFNLAIYGAILAQVLLVLAASQTTSPTRSEFAAVVVIALSAAVYVAGRAAGIRGMAMWFRAWFVWLVVFALTAAVNLVLMTILAG